MNKNLPNYHAISLKATEGSRVKICQCYFVGLIAVVSTLFMEYQNSNPFRRYDQFNFLGY